MGFMIQLLFEPSLLGVEKVWCTNCGCVSSPSDVVWRTDSNPSSSRDPIGNDVDESPHHPMCPCCGYNETVKDAIFDGLNLRARFEPTLYPRREGKDIKVWEHVAPYRTRKGRMSEWKLDMKASKRATALYDRIQSKLGFTMKLSEAMKYNNCFIALHDVYGDIPCSRGFLYLVLKPALVLVRERRVWKGERKSWKGKTWRKSRSSFAGMDPMNPKRTMWHHTSEVSDPKWVKMEDYWDALAESGYSMARGKWFTIDDGSAWWYDPNSGESIMVAGPDFNWSMCQYDEDQGADEESWYEEALNPEDEFATQEEPEPEEENEEDEK